MDKSSKLKIVLLGPTNAGKTSIANFLSDVTENVTGDIRKTRGVRIVEFQVDKTVNGQPSNVDVELWDCGGDKKYETYYQVFLHEANGVIFVCAKGELEQRRELESLNTIVSEHAPTAKKILFFHNFDDNDYESKSKKNVLAKVEQIVVNVELNADELRKAFHSFVTTIEN